MSDKGEKIVEIVNSYNPETIVEVESPFIKLFGKDILLEIQSEIKDGNQGKEKSDITKLLFDATSQRIRELLSADNFSLLTGAGSSVTLGSVLFAKKELLKIVGSQKNLRLAIIKSMKRIIRLYYNCMKNILKTKIMG